MKKSPLVSDVFFHSCASAWTRTRDQSCILSRKKTSLIGYVQSAPAWTRTRDQSCIRRRLYQLSYRRTLLTTLFVPFQKTTALPTELRMHIIIHTLYETPLGTHSYQLCTKSADFVHLRSQAARATDAIALNYSRNKGAIPLYVRFMEGLQ